tara:strand:- start:1474 stop:1896 length:423 start_codon:yes stop_codon:yes gene_type:complete
MNREVDLLLTRLHGVRGKEGRWIARCPAHEDKTPSLSIGLGDDGRVLIHCHAGCGAVAVVEAVGLQISDLMPQDPQYYLSRQYERSPRVDYKGIIFHLRHQFYVLSIAAGKVKNGESLNEDEEQAMDRVAKSFERLSDVH